MRKRRKRKTTSDYTVAVDEDRVTIVMDRWEALSMARILLDALGEYSPQRTERSRLRGVARRIIISTRPEKLPKFGHRVERPPSGYRSEFDIDHVLNGPKPYPVLSLEDMDEVYPQLERRGLSATEIGARLYVAPRTVVRWRTEGLQRRKGKE